MIEVERIGTNVPFEFDVRVREGKNATRHHVTMAPADYERLSGGKVTPERLIETAFEFLLGREPKESILSRFDVTVIGRYFPEFEREIGRLLSTRRQGGDQ